MTDTEFEYDPYSYEIDLDPYPLYQRMRDEAPAYYNPRLDFWALTRFQDCHDAFLDWQTYSSAQGTVLELMGDQQFSGSLIIFMDPPKQTRYRNLVSKAFTPARMRALEPRIRAITVEYLDRLKDLPRFDVVREFTAKLPMDVISTLLGIPKQDRDQVRGWSNDLLHRDAGNPMPTKRGIESMLKLQSYFDEQMAERRRQPKDDMMTVLVEAEIDGEKLDANEIHGFCNLLATAGNETVTKLLASAFYWLNAFPDQRRILVEEPAVIPNAVEEFLRFDPPSQYQGRTLTRPVTLHGVALPAEARVLLLTGSACRDEQQFADADRFDIARGRDIPLQMAFGHGAHKCLGAALARLEARVALEELHARIPEYTVDEAACTRVHMSNVHGFASVPMTW